ncbi:MAG: hypothetical protein Q7R91_02890 [bacterium]|nr:hypothetical protein [bacterium]
MKNNKINQDDSNTGNRETLLEKRETKVVVGFPDKIGIELVQANELRHYELFQWLVILVAPIAVGFWTAYVAEPLRPNALWWSALAFSGFTVIFIAFAVYYRRKVFHGSILKEISLAEFK